VTGARASLTLVALACCTPTLGASSDTPSAPFDVCPQGRAPDAVREARLLARLVPADGGAVDLPRDLARLVAPVCFGPARSAGVLAGQRVVLRAASSDDELAARLAHLAVHLEDGLGDGCAHGLARALASENRANALERALRESYGLAPQPDDPADAARDYARRCSAR
jgi:hypothetical protein